VGKREIIESLNFGDRVAENEAATLKNYFVNTQDWDRVFQGQTDIVYGPKGSGKSAIYLLLQESTEDLFDRSILFVPAENVRGATAFTQVAADPPTSENEFIRLWKLYLLTLIGEAFAEYKLSSAESELVLKELAAAGLLEKRASLTERLAAVIRYVRAFIKWEAVEGGVTVDPNTGMPVGFTGRIIFGSPTVEQARLGAISVDRLFELANAALTTFEVTVWLGVDRLDVAFPDNEQLESNALRALFRTYLDLQAQDRIRLKIFLRSDIWARITQGGFREASHITSTLTISWPPDLLLNLVLRRLLQSRLFVATCEFDSAAILKDIKLQEKTFYKAFPEQVDVGARRPKTFDWMLSRTCDGTRQTAPRELIHLLNSISEIELRMIGAGIEERIGDALFSRQAIKEALQPVSKARLEQTLYAEHPTLKGLIERLEGLKATQTVPSLTDIWRVERDEVLRLAEQLVDVGFFERRGTREAPQYWIPFLYRDALSLVQGVADET